MMTEAALLSIPAALFAGLAGSAHCLVMCGGMAGALGMRARAMSAKSGRPPSAMWATLLYQIGRVGGYAIAGALLGFLGAGVQSTLNMSALSTAMRCASGVLLILIAVRLALRWNALALIERAGARIWRVLQPVTHRASRRTGRFDSLLLGLLWGWLPCGLVYSMLALSALSGSPARGAALMIAFGLGTLPAMLAGSLLAARLFRIGDTPWARPTGAVLLALFGVWQIAAALPDSHGATHIGAAHAGGNSQAALQYRHSTPAEGTSGSQLSSSRARIAEPSGPGATS